MIVFTETKGAIDNHQIEEIERFVGLKFPLEYKKHLLRFNGGRCFPNIATFTEKGQSTSSDVDWFLAIYDGKHSNLKDYIEIVKIDEKRMPQHLFPFAHDSGGNLYCLSCGDDDYGKVYFWDHENEVDYYVSDDSDYSNLYLVSDSFNEFLTGLTED